MRLGWRTLLDPVHFVALGFGAGLAPRAPGTFGTLVALLPAWWCFTLPWPWRIGHRRGRDRQPVSGSAAKAPAGSASTTTAASFSTRSLGCMLTALALPENTFLWLALAFVLFRVFDIWKPWPIREVDHRLKGGAGIMLDDLMAAVYAAVCLVGLRAFLPTIVKLPWCSPKPKLPQRSAARATCRTVSASTSSSTRSGRAAPGSVFLSHDPYYGRDVAIKLYNIENEEDEQKARVTRKMFFNEAQMMGRLQHPNILPIYDAGEENGSYYVVTEHVHGARTLDRILPPRQPACASTTSSRSFSSARRVCTTRTAAA